VNKRFLAEKQELLKKLLAAHVAITQQINADKSAAAIVLNEQLKKETGKALKSEVITRALNRVELTWDPIGSSLRKSAETAHSVGFLRTAPRLDGIYSLKLLNAVLREQNLPEVGDSTP
jgi:NitT/TauT family transport system substrate-binding protein